MHKMTTQIMLLLLTNQEKDADDTHSLIFVNSKFESIDDKSDGSGSNLDQDLLKDMQVPEWLWSNWWGWAWSQWLFVGMGL